MRFLTLTTLLSLAGLCTAQPDLPYERVYEVPGALWTMGVTMDGDGNIYTVTELNPDENNLQVTKITADAEHAWTKVYPFYIEMGTYNNSIAIGPEGLIVGGYAIGTGTASRDGLILRIDPEDGTLLQSTRIDAFGGSNAIHAISRIADGFIAAGRANGGGGMYDMLMAKLDNGGNMLWSRTYGSAGWDWAEEAQAYPGGGFVVVGYGDSLVGPTAPAGYVVKTDALGNELWARSISNNTQQGGSNWVLQPECMAVDASGNIYVGGSTLGYQGNPSNPAMVTKLSPAGNHLWSRILPDAIATMRLQPLSNGGMAWLVRPHLFPGGPGSYDVGWGTFDADGNTTSSHYYGTQRAETPSHFFPRTDGGFVVVNRVLTANSQNNSDFKLSVIYTDTEGNADCNNADIPLNWQPATFSVQPFISVTNSGFEAFNFPLGEQAVMVGSYDPCCNVNASFTMASHGNDYSWGFTDASTAATSYFWDFGDGTTSIEQSPTHIFAANGTYNVCLTVTGTCGQATTCQTVSITVGINDVVGSGAAIVIQPSPANEFFTVRSHRSPVHAVQLFDADGCLVEGTANKTGASMTVQVAHLPNGLYMARVQLADGTFHHQRVMVVH